MKLHVQHLYCARSTVTGTGGADRGNRNLSHKTPLHADSAFGKLLLQCFLGACRACERAGVKNFTRKIVRQKNRVDATGYLRADYHEDQAPVAPCSFRWIREFALPKNDFNKKQG